MSSYIRARNICVDFPVYENSHRSLKNTVFNLSTGGKLGNDGRKHSVVRAVDNLTFDFEEGARVGLTGHNGSGKTTLLRVLSGIYAPVSGSLQVQGRVASLLDVSMGLDPDATGFENIYLRGILQGLPPAAIKAKTDDIAEFSELGEYLNLPVRTYSSGMLMRLAFAISTSVEADILVMDEWLSVGDQSFREKAAERLQSIVDQASILVIATHDPGLVKRVCNRQLHLEHGQVISDEVVVPDPEQESIAESEPQSPAADQQQETIRHEATGTFQ